MGQTDGLVFHSHINIIFIILPTSGADITNVKREDAGLLLSDVMKQYMYDLKIEDGLRAVGYTPDDIPALVKGTLPQASIAFKRN